MTTLAVHSGQLTLRGLRTLLRQPVYVAITLVQPMIWLLLFGQLFRRIADLPGFSGASYITYLAPGVVIMTALFGSRPARSAPTSGRRDEAGRCHKAVAPEGRRWRVR